MKQITRFGVFALITLFSAVSAIPESQNAFEQRLRDLLRSVLDDYRADNDVVKNDATAPSGLAVQTVTNARIEGTYHDTINGGGIHFLSEANENGGGQMYIATLQGEPIIHAIKSHRNAGVKLMSVLGHHFLLGRVNQNSRATIENMWSMAEEFVVPDKHLPALSSAIQFHDEVMIASLLKHFDSSSAVQMVRERAISNLMSRAEIQMMAKAAKALAETGVSGVDNAAARAFYVYAMRLENSQREKSVLTQGSVVSPIFNGYNVMNRYDKPKTYGDTQSVAAAAAGDMCTRKDFESCASDKCPTGQYCRGMCGPSCYWCWRFICGDCCYHEGCAQHDDCCEEKGYLSWACSSAPIGFKCEGPYECEKV